MHLEQLVFFVIFGAVGIANMLMRKEGAKKDTRRPPISGGSTGPRNQGDWQQSQPQRQAQQTMEDERLRKFMEALGVPSDAPPPRKISRPPPQPVTARALPQRVPPVVKRQAPPPRPVVAPARARAESAYQTETVGRTQAAKIDYEIHEIQVPVAAAVSAASVPGTTAAPLPTVDFRSLLRSPSSVRTAMVLKEILGPPRALQQMDGPPGLR